MRVTKPNDEVARIALVTIIVVLVVLVFSAFGQAQTIEPYRAVARFSVGGITGSGTLIGMAPDGRGLMLSCRHVCQTVGRQIDVQFLWANDFRAKGRVIYVLGGDEFDTDIALVEIDRVPPNVSPVRVVPFDPAAGPWIAAGFRDGVMRLAGPIGSAYTRGRGMIVLPVPFIGGQSGGALFNRYGQVIGVVVASDRETIGVSADGPQLHAIVNKFVH